MYTNNSLHRLAFPHGPHPSPTPTNVTCWKGTSDESGLFWKQKVKDKVEEQKKSKTEMSKRVTNCLLCPTDISDHSSI